MTGWWQKMLESSESVLGHNAKNSNLKQIDFVRQNPSYLKLLLGGKKINGFMRINKNIKHQPAGHVVAV